MMVRNFLLMGVGAFGVACQPALAQDHAPAPLIGSRAVEVPSGPSYASQIADIKAAFQAQYGRAGAPRVAIFWNRKLDDQLSQWYTASRNIDTRDYWRGGGFTATQRRLDVEDRFDDRPQPNELAGFEFGAGLTRTLINAGVDIVDRDAIMRLTHNRTEAVEDGIVVSDYQEVEMDALSEHADLFIEVLYAPTAGSDEPLTVMISIKEVRTGKVAAMFRSRKTSLPEAATRTEWVAGRSGYEQREVPVENVEAVPSADGIAVGTPEHLGWNVALQTMQELTRYWNAY